jgi:GT2 family glycosyltransferase
MRVSVVIPNWNGADKLRKHLPEVLKVKGVDEVIVSDDGSTDNSLAVLEKEFPEVKVAKRETQGGFSTNVHHGVKHATGDLVYLLNSDASPEPDSLQKTLKHFDDPKVFSVSCNVGGNWSWAKWEKGFFWHYMSSQDDEKPKAHQTLWASGGSMVFRKKVWEELGGFDLAFNPFYEEDVDLGYRATKRGFINIFEPESEVEHYKEPGVIAQNYSQAKINKTAQRNQLLLIWKNIHDPKMMREHQAALFKMLLIHPKYWEVFLKALILLPQILEKRKIEKKHAKVSDKEIFNKFRNS